PGCGGKKPSRILRWRYCRRGSTASGSERDSHWRFTSRATLATARGTDSPACEHLNIPLASIANHDKTAPAVRMLVSRILHHFQGCLPERLCSGCRRTCPDKSGLESLMKLHHQLGCARRLDLPLTDNRPRTTGHE